MWFACSARRSGRSRESYRNASSRPDACQGYGDERKNANREALQHAPFRRATASAFRISLAVRSGYFHMNTKKVFVSGCFDMLHSGHVRFLEQASTYGELHVG